VAHKDINTRIYYYSMIFVLSFAAVVFLVQKFDFRNCMLKSNNTDRGTDDFISKDDGDDYADNLHRSNDTLHTVASAESE
jgi:hypothetical protein